MTEARTSGEASPSISPKGAAAALGTLILVAAVANLNLAVANVALPDIGKDLDASQTGLNLIAVGYSPGSWAVSLPVWPTRPHWP